MFDHHTHSICPILIVCACLQTASREADILAEVGDGGFAAQEFELVEQIGQLSWVRNIRDAVPDVLLHDSAHAAPLVKRNISTFLPFDQYNIAKHAAKPMHQRSE